MQNLFNQFQPNILPPQQIIQVNGKASVDFIQMSPNSSVLLLDTTAPIVWLCVSDGIGRVTATPFDITEHKDDSQQAQSLEDRIVAIEHKLEELHNESKSNATRFGTKPNEPKPLSGKKLNVNNENTK